MSEELGEGKQLQLFRVKLRKAVEDAVGFQNDDHLSAISGIPNIKHKKLLSLTSIFKQKVVKNFCEEVEKIVKEEELDKLLKRREEIINQQKNFEGTIAWRPSGSVTEDIRSHDMEILRSKSTQLSCMCEAKEKEVAALFRQVSKARGNISEYEAQLSKNIDEIDRLEKCVQDQEDAFLRVKSAVIPH